MADPPFPIHVSLSHGDDQILIGIAAVPIGVDIEAPPTPETAAEVSSRLHPAKQAESPRPP